MPNLDLELNPTISLKLDAIGKPGQRTFYLQGSDDHQTVTLLIEKFQVQMLALGIEQFLNELKKRFPDLPAVESEYDEKAMRLTPPLDPLFRVAAMSMGYDADTNFSVLILREGKISEEAEDKPSMVRFWCTRSMVSGLAVWAQELVGRGRPIWPSTGEPMSPRDQYSPRNNGHKH